MSDMDVGLSLPHPAFPLEHALQLLPQARKGLGAGPAHWSLLVPTQKAVIVTVTVARPEGRWNREGGQSETEPQVQIAEVPDLHPVLGLCSPVHVGDGITMPSAHHLRPMSSEA